MSRTRTIVLSAAAATLAVAAVAYGASAGGPAGRPPTGGPANAAALDDSVFAAALGASDDTDGNGRGPGGKGRMAMGMRHGPMVGMGQWVLHGEGVVKDRDGTFVTVAVQSGAVTAVDDGSVTVKSEDGYSSTWALTDATRYLSFPDQAGKADLKVGVDVRVAGSVTDGKATARLVWFPPKAGTLPPRHLPKLESPHPGMPKPPVAPGPPNRLGPSGSAPQPSPSTTTSSSSTTA